MIHSYLGLGSNLNHPQRQLRQALRAIKTLPRTALIKQSKLYLTEPLGLPGQPFYFNMVVLITTTLSPKQLLRYCKRIEESQHRVRKKKWGPRTLDIDILLYGQRTIQTPELVIPHPFMAQRDFVMRPLQEILPSTHPFSKRVGSYKKNYIVKTC